MIRKKPAAGWEIEEKEKPILKQNIRQMKNEFKPPRQLPKFSQKATCSKLFSNSQQLPNYQTPTLKLNVSTPSVQKRRGRKRKRTERLTDSEEESESEEVI